MFLGGVYSTETKKQSQLTDIDGTLFVCVWHGGNTCAVSTSKSRPSLRHPTPDESTLEIELPDLTWQGTGVADEIRRAIQGT